VGLPHLTLPAPRAERCGVTVSFYCVMITSECGCRQGVSVRQKDKEATVREVLAEVNLLDVGAAIKSILVQLGCTGIFILASVFIGQGINLFAGSEDAGWGIPDWVYWVFLIWVMVSIYTSEYSYHDHRFAWYFPKLGWFWSLPFAFYIFATIQLFRAIDTNASWEIRLLQVLLLWLWMIPFFLFIAILEIGHNRVIEKRNASKEAAKAEREKNSPRAYDWLTDDDD
jgi:hypothetical protein